MILPEGYEAMTVDEIERALLEMGLDAESARVYAELANDPDPGFDIE